MYEPLYLSRSAPWIPPFDADIYTFKVTVYGLNSDGKATKWAQTVGMTAQVLKDSRYHAVDALSRIAAELYQAMADAGGKPDMRERPIAHLSWRPRDGHHQGWVEVAVRGWNIR